MIASYKSHSKKALAVFLGTLALIILVMVVHGRNALVSLLVLVNGVSFYWACWAYIKAKGRSSFWLLAPVIFLYGGVIVLWFLADQSAPEKKADEAVDGLPEWARVKQ